MKVVSTAKTQVESKFRTPDEERKARWRIMIECVCRGSLTTRRQLVVDCSRLIR